MTVLSGVNHVATVTRDLDRLVRFYRDAFEDPDARFPEAMFERGRIDHVGLAVADQDALVQVRDRLVELGASDGVVTDFGPVCTSRIRTGWSARCAGSRQEPRCVPMST